MTGTVVENRENKEPPTASPMDTWLQMENHEPCDKLGPSSAFSCASKRSQMVLPWDGTLNNQSHIHLI